MSLVLSLATKSALSEKLARPTDDNHVKLIINCLQLGVVKNTSVSNHNLLS